MVYEGAFSLDDPYLLSTDVELLKWFDKNPDLRGEVNFTNYEPQSKYERSCQERRYIRKNGRRKRTH